MTKSIGDRLHAKSAVSAAVGVLSDLQEEAPICGKFTAVLEGYKEEHKDEYLRLFARLELMKDKYRGSILRRLGVPVDLGREIEQLEKYMKTLTEVKAVHEFPNTVLTAGKNYLLDNALAGSSFTAAYYMGLISSVSYSAINAADTASSHAGWLEAGATNAPTYSGTRKTTAWSSASAGSKALSAGLVFTFTGSGTVKGAFIGTTNTVDATTGTFISAGLFTGGDQPVVNTNTLTVTYSLAL